MSKKELDVKYEVGKKAEELMAVLQNSELSFGQGLDALAFALVVSALNAEIDKESFLKTMGVRYDHLSNLTKDHDETFFVDTSNNIH
jgi:chromosome condensin MukBEF complex kleisin-like MukF subunit